jgi:type VI secretion system protein ImpA
MPIDPAPLLADIDEAAPAGENLEFDIEFGGLERAAAGKPEQQYGGVVIPAEDPDWKEVRAQAESLLTRTRDLRVLVQLALAELHLEGIAGFAVALDVIRKLLDAKWPHLHPQLDPDDDNDPTLRANALLSLADPGRVLRKLRDMPLANSARSGPVSWRDMEIAAGAMEPVEGREKLSESVLRGAFQDTDQARLASLREGLVLAIASAAGIPAAFDANAGFGTGPDLSGLAKLLRETQRYVDRYAPQGAPGEQEAEDAAPGNTAVGEPAPAAGRAAGVSAASLSAVTTRADAMRLLDLVLDYYRRYEPSSPLPLLLERARRLADKNFIDILRDLAPDSVSQAQFVTGARDD